VVQVITVHVEIGDQTRPVRHQSKRIIGYRQVVSARIYG